MKELEDLADKSPVTRILDHEACRSKIQHIFQRVNEATISFVVRTIMFIQGYVYSNRSFSARNDDQHPANDQQHPDNIKQTVSEIRDDTKVSI